LQCGRYETSGNLHPYWVNGAIADATTDRDLRSPPSNHFEKLRGKLADFHSIRVNKQWRLIFKWDGSRGEATSVYLDDHSYM
jgi:proteic killer suppression protein